MKVPSCVLWQLTKNNSKFIRRPTGSKSRLDSFSTDPLNLTGLHNASSQGFTADNAYGLGMNKAESKTKKKFNREYVLRINHKSYHNNSKFLKNKNGQAGLCHTTQRIKHGTNQAAKTIKGLHFATDAKKALLLKRLGRLHAASRAHVKK